jgi:alpha-N-arabinofuranosidase
VWFQQRFEGEKNLEIREAPELIEDVYDVTDAVVVGSLLITLMRHTDRVAMACQAQLVNVIAPIATESGGPAWRQTIFHPFALTARHARGTVLRPAVRSDTVDTPAFGRVDQLLVTATLDEDNGDLVVFVVNRSRTEECELTLDLVGLTGAPAGGHAAYRLIEHLVLHDDDPSARNTRDEPERVVPQPGNADLDGATLRAVLPPISWHCIRLTEGKSR